MYIINRNRYINWCYLAELLVDFSLICFENNKKTRKKFFALFYGIPIFRKSPAWFTVKAMLEGWILRPHWLVEFVLQHEAGTASIVSDHTLSLHWLEFQSSGLLAPQHRSWNIQKYNFYWFISIFVLRIMAYFSKTVNSHVLNTMTSFLSTVLKTLDPLMQFLWFWNFVGNFFKKVKKNNPFKITKSSPFSKTDNRTMRWCQLSM